MTSTYIKPKTKTIKVKQQQHIMAGSEFNINSGAEPINGNQGLARGFDFFFEEEEVTSEKDDDDWEEWEDEDP